MQRTQDLPNSVTCFYGPAKVSAAKGHGLGLTCFGVLQSGCHNVLHVTGTVVTEERGKNLLFKKKKSAFQDRRMKVSIFQSIIDLGEISGACPCACLQVHASL